MSWRRRRVFALPFMLLAISVGPAAVSDDMLGRAGLHVTAATDTLLDLALEHDLGFVEIVAANPGLDPWLPGAGRPVLLPTAHLLPASPRRGIVINLADQRLYYFLPRGAVRTYPIGVSSEGVTISLGTARIVGKRVNPVWFPPPSVRAEAPDLPESVPPGPDNPLGAFALDLSWPAPAIHGTNNPYGIGRRVSHGCFRLYPEDIEKLFRQVAIGTEVTVVNQPIKLGWSAGTLFLEVHPTLEQADELELRGTASPAALPDLRMLVMEMAGAAADEVDWAAVNRIARQHKGVPFQILRSASPLPP